MCYTRTAEGAAWEASTAVVDRLDELHAGSDGPDVCSDPASGLVTYSRSATTKIAVSDTETGASRRLSSILPM